MKQIIKELRDRKVIKIAIVYVIGSWLLMQVADVMFPALGLPDWTITLVVALLIIGFPVALILAWAYEATPEGIRRDPGKRSNKTAWSAAALLLGSGAVIWWWSFSDRSGIDDNKTVAVLPFADLSPGGDQAYFSDGIHEEIIRRLSAVDDLHVVSRTSVLRYRNPQQSVTKIAEQLSADAILEGSVRHEDDRIRVTAQLIDGRTDKHIWAQNYDRELTVSNIIAIQSDIAEQISQALEAELTDVERSKIATLPTSDVDAYNLYLLGRYHTFRQTEENLEKAVEFLEQAVERDPDFAAAYVNLAYAYSFLGTSYGSLAPEIAYAKARAAAQRALQLDPDLDGAHGVLGDILAWYDWDWPAAEAEFKTVLELNPDNVLSYSLFLSTQGRHDEAIALIERSIERQPKDGYIHINAAWRFYNARLYERAIEEALLSDGHPDMNSVLGWVALAQGRNDEAMAYFEADLERFGRKPNVISNLAIGHSRLRQTEQANELLAELLERAEQGYFSPVTIADVYFDLGDADEGFAWLQRGFDAQTRELMFLKVNHSYDNHRDDPRYRDLVERLGL
ncbi:MAG: tetratricopeptide repeat protein [Gammaproteobacteria bacterium]